MGSFSDSSPASRMPLARILQPAFEHVCAGIGVLLSFDIRRGHRGKGYDLLLRAGEQNVEPPFASESINGTEALGDDSRARFLSPVNGADENDVPLIALNVFEIFIKNSSSPSFFSFHVSIYFLTERLL